MSILPGQTPELPTAAVDGTPCTAEPAPVEVEPAVADVAPVPQPVVGQRIQPGPWLAPSAAAGYPPPWAFPRNDLAIWSLVLGAAGLMVGCLLVTGIPAVILGHSARGAIARGEANNAGVATAGIALGWISIGLSVALLAVFIVVPVLGALPLLFV